MRKYIAAFALMASTFTAGPALASGNSTSGPTVGNCISDILYGNEPNIVGPFAPGGPAEQLPGTKGGQVVPTQSPGPFVNVPSDPTNPRPGPSVGDLQKKFGAGSVLEYCRFLGG